MRITPMFFWTGAKTEIGPPAGGDGSLLAHDCEGFSQRLGKEYGLGAAKAAQLKAALEMGRRLGLTQLDEKYQFYFACPLMFINILVWLVSWLYYPLLTVKIYCYPSPLLSTSLSRNLFL
jgi:hypothetical protein